MIFSGSRSTSASIFRNLHTRANRARCQSSELWERATGPLVGSAKPHVIEADLVRRWSARRSLHCEIVGAVRRRSKNLCLKGLIVYCILCERVKIHCTNSVLYTRTARAATPRDAHRLRVGRGCCRCAVRSVHPPLAPIKAMAAYWRVQPARQDRASTILEHAAA